MIKATIIIALVIIIISSTVTVNAKEKGDLTLKIKLDYQYNKASYYKKVNISVGKFDKFYDLSDFPSSITLKHLDVKVGKFKVCANNYVTDDGECTTGNNSIEKKPEKVTLYVP